MENKSISFTVEELHKIIWEESISKFSRRLGLNESHVRKQYKEHSIPTPDTAYWTNKAFDKPVAITSLPKNIDPHLLIELHLKKEKRSLFTNPRQQDNSKQKRTSALKSKTEHPLVQLTREVFKKRKARKPGDWRSYQDEPDILAINVQDQNEERALNLFNDILLGLNARGYKVTTSSHSLTEVAVEDVKIPIRLREKNKRTLRKESNVSWNEYDYTPTGILVFVSEYQRYKRKEYYDKPFVKLEEKTNQIIEDIINEGIFETQEHRRWAINRKLEEEKKAKERARRKKVNQELREFTTLFPIQNRWHQARILREYLLAYEKHLENNNQLSEDRVEWLAWARKKADWYDPFIELEDESMSGIDRDTLEPLKDGWY